MNIPTENTEVFRMLKDVRENLWKTVSPVKDMNRNFPEYISSLTGECSSSIYPNLATRLNFSISDDSILSGDSSLLRGDSSLPIGSSLQSDISFMKSIETPESLKRKLMVTTAELRASRAKLKETESTIGVMEPSSKRICIDYESKLEEYKKKSELDSLKIEELKKKIKQAQYETAQAKNRINELVRQRKTDTDNLEMKIRSLQQDYNSMKSKIADVNSEKAETVRKLNFQIGKLELQVSMITKENEKSQEHIQSLKKQNNELAEKAGMAKALEKELNEANGRIKMLENKIEANKDAALIINTRQSELKKLAELQKENCMLKEEVNKNRETNIALYQEKLWTYQEKLKHAEKKSLAFAKLQMENEQLTRKLAQWTELFADKNSPFKSPAVLSVKLSQYQKNEVVLTNKVAQLTNQCETLMKQKNELEGNNKALSSRLQQYQTTSPNQDSLIKRLQRKVIFLTKERDHSRNLFDNYLSEATIAGAGLNAELVTHLQDMNMEYKRALEKTEKDVDSLTEKLRALTESQRTDKFLIEINKLQQGKSSLMARIADLEREKNALEAKCCEQKTADTPSGFVGRFFHLRHNPVDNANKRHLEAFKELQDENDHLKKRVKVLEEEGAAAADVTLKVQQKLAEEGSDSTIRGLQEQLAAAEKQQRYILDSARAKSTEFREAVYRLTGYCIDVPTSEQYKLSHVYAESSDDYLMFQINSEGVQLIETEYSKQLLDKIELYLLQHDSFPAFIASLTMDLFSQQTYMAA